MGLSFGPDVTKRFLEQNNLEYVVRSHECKDGGYEVAHDGRCITVFSAPNYCDQVGNKGSIVIFKDDLKPNFVTFDAVVRAHHPQSHMTHMTHMTHTTHTTHTTHATHATHALIRMCVCVAFCLRSLTRTCRRWPTPAITRPCSACRERERDQSKRPLLARIYHEEGEHVGRGWRWEGSVGDDHQRHDMPRPMFGP